MGTIRWHLYDTEHLHRLELKQHFRQVCDELRSVPMNRYNELNGFAQCSCVFE